MIVLAIVASVLADEAPRYQEPSYGPASYSYNWAVQDDYSNNNYGQSEERNGDKTTGSYYVS